MSIPNQEGVYLLRSYSTNGTKLLVLNK